LEVLRGVDAGRNLGFADRYRNAETVPQHPQLLEGLGLLQRAVLEGRELLEETDAVSVDPGVPVPGAPLLPRIGNARPREVKGVALMVEHHLHDVRVVQRAMQGVARG